MGMQSGSEVFKRRVAYSITVIILTFYYEYKAGLNIKHKYVCIAMWLLVMSLCSHDFLMMSLYIF